jgi:phosphohistidine swiveling domain-containing protein
MVAFDADTAERWAKEDGKDVIMVRPETKPDDVHGMLAAKGILTSRGGRTSHAALVARQFGKPGVVGVWRWRSTSSASPRWPRSTFGRKEGDWISLDGTTGEVFAGKIDTDGARHRRPVPAQAARSGPTSSAAGRVGQRRLPARRRARPRVRRRGHRPVPHRAHVLRDRAPADRAAHDLAKTKPSATRRCGSCCRFSAPTSTACSARWTACRSPSA